MILTQRSAMIGNGLPYDAEIEYIRMTSGAGFIMPSLTFSSTDIFMITTRFVTSSKNLSPFYFGTPSKGFAIRINGVPDFVWVLDGRANTIKSGNQQGTGWFTATLIHDGVSRNVIDGISECNSVSRGPWSSPVTANMQLGLSRNAFNTRATMDFREVKHKLHDGTVMFYLRPVRKGQKAYFYDEVSGAMYCNTRLDGESEYGEFSLGPDVLPSSRGGGGHKYLVPHYRRLFYRSFEERRAA